MIVPQNLAFGATYSSLKEKLRHEFETSTAARIQRSVFQTLQSPATWKTQHNERSLTGAFCRTWHLDGARRDALRCCSCQVLVAEDITHQVQPCSFLRPNSRICWNSTTHHVVLAHLLYFKQVYSLTQRVSCCSRLSFS